MVRVGVVTIGQAPRQDLVPELARWLDDVQFVERGALDELDSAQITELAPTASDEVLVTRLRTGTGVRLAARHVHPRVLAAIRDVGKAGVDATLVVCTARLPHIENGGPVLWADGLLQYGVAGITDGQRLGVVCPDLTQRDAILARWREVCDDPLIASAPPYAPDVEEQVAAAAADLHRQGARFVVLDCIGYSLGMQCLARRACGVPVLLARSVVARMAAATLESLPRQRRAMVAT